MTSTISIEIPREVVHASRMLASRKIHVHYDVEDYEEDLTTQKELGRL